MDSDELERIEERRRHADSVIRGEGNGREVSPRVEVSVKQFLVSGAVLGIILIIIVVCLQLLGQAVSGVVGKAEKGDR